MDEHQSDLPDHELLSTLGTGVSGMVFLAKHRQSKKKVAIKVIPREGSIKTIEESIRRELAFLSLLSHPNIIELYEIRDFPETAYLIMEYFEGKELFDVVSKKALSEDRFRPLFRQLVDALAYLHRHNVCHRDIKPENILVNKSLTKLKLIDFGYSNSFGDPSHASMSTLCGSPHYLAPEIILGRNYGPKVDIWSLGCVLFSSLTSRCAFGGRDLDSIYQEIVHEPPRLHTAPTPLSSGVLGLLSAMLQKKPEDRYSLEDVRLHPWVSIKHYGPPAGHKMPRRLINFCAADPDESILAEMCMLGFAEQDSRAALAQDSFGMIANVYHLIAEKRQAEWEAQAEKILADAMARASRIPPSKPPARIPLRSTKKSLSDQSYNPASIVASLANDVEDESAVSSQPDMSSTTTTTTTTATRGFVVPSTPQTERRGLRSRLRRKKGASSASTPSLPHVDSYAAEDTIFPATGTRTCPVTRRQLVAVGRDATVVASTSDIDAANEQQSPSLSRRARRFLARKQPSSTSSMDDIGNSNEKLSVADTDDFNSPMPPLHQRPVSPLFFRNPFRRLLDALRTPQLETPSSSAEHQAPTPYGVTEMPLMEEPETEYQTQTDTAISAVAFADDTETPTIVVSSALDVFSEAPLETRSDSDSSTKSNSASVVVEMAPLAPTEPEMFRFETFV